jgi:hypothetical protein
MSRFPPDRAKSLPPSSRSLSEPVSRQENERDTANEMSLARAIRGLLDARRAALLPHRLRLLEIETRQRIAQYRSHYDPNQPRVPAGNSDGGQWTRVGGYEGGRTLAGLGPQSVSSRPDMARGGPIFDSAAPEVQLAATSVDIGNALTGISTIDDTTKALTNMLVQVGDTIAYLPGRSPQKYGILVHIAFAAAVRSANLPGIGYRDVETTFSLEPDARYGSKLSIRTDVVLRNAAGEIIAIYDVKTGDADLGPKRVKALQAKTRAAPGTPVIQLHLTHGPSRKAEQIDPHGRSRQASLQINLRRI